MWNTKLVRSFSRDPLDDDTADVLPWESSSREGVYGVAGRRRQDSAADSGSSSSDVSAAVAVGVGAAERTRRLPQQSTLDGGLRGAPPPLRRLSAVEPRHLAPLGSPPHSPRAPRRPPPAVAAPPPHPTPTISVSSAPDDESAASPPGTGSPDEPRSVAQSDEPSSVFASADATPTEPSRPPFRPADDRVTLAADGPAPSLDPGCDDSRTEVSRVPVSVRSAPESRDDSVASGAMSDSKDSERTKSSDDEAISVRGTPARGSSTAEEIGPASSKDTGSKIGDLPGPVPAKEGSVDTVATSVCSAGAPDADAPRSPAPCEPEPERAGAPRPPVAPLAVCEDIGVDDDNVDKVPLAPLQRVSAVTEAAFESNATKKIAHTDELSSVSESDIVKRDNKSGIGERKQRNDICPWEDE